MAQSRPLGGYSGYLRGLARKGDKGAAEELQDWRRASPSNIRSSEVEREAFDLSQGMATDRMMAEREGRGMIAEGRQSLLDQPVGGRLVSQFAPGMSEIDKSRQVAAQGGFGRGAQLREERRQFDASPQGQVQQTQGIIAEGRRVAGLGENAPQDQLKQRQALFAEMSDAKTPQQLAAFRERATSLGVDDAGWKQATGRLDQMRGGPLAQMERELNTPATTSPSILRPIATAAPSSAATPAPAPPAAPAATPQTSPSILRPIATAAPSSAATPLPVATDTEDTNTSVDPESTGPSRTGAGRGTSARRMREEARRRAEQARRNK